MVEAYEDWLDRYCQGHCRTTFGRARLPWIVAEEVRKRARKEECFRPSFLCVEESDKVWRLKRTVEENAKAKSR